MLGPDAQRYIHLAVGNPVPRPFHLRRLLPYFCGSDGFKWAVAYFGAWPIAAIGMLAWRVPVDGWGVAVAATLLLLALPGILGPAAVIPVGVDLPATAVTLVGVALIAEGHPARIVAGVGVIMVAAGIKESAPVWAALWVWSPWPLIALMVPATVAVLRKPGPDPLGAKFQEIADHPVRAAWQHHRGQWRNAWVMAAPWGVCLAGLVGADWRLLLVLGVAYAQLLVATDSVRLFQHAAGPVLAVAAANVIPVAWLPLAVAVHVVWWRTPERI